jgi:hypothetical protein
VTPDKQFEPTVIPRHMRAASAPFHYALAAALDSAARGGLTAALAVTGR